MSAVGFTLALDPFGQLVFTGADGMRHAGVAAVRAFPITAPAEAVSLLDADGHELAWIEQLGQCPQHERKLIEAQLSEREFMPLLVRLKSVSSFTTPCTWEVTTDRGDTQFVLKGEEHIRRLAPGLLIVSDAHGVQYLIRNPEAMDRASRRLLDRFL